MKEPIADNPEGLKVFVWISHHAIVGVMAERGKNAADPVIAKMVIFFKVKF